jgi:hypothetical protein
LRIIPASFSGDDATPKEIDDMLAEHEPEIEQSEAVVSSELLELRSLRRR